MRSLAVAVLFAALASISNTQVIDPDSVPLDQRKTWCTNQMTSCPLLCLQYPGQSAATAANDCDAETLNYHCVCENGLSPNASEYSQTIPFYICQEAGNQCVLACGLNHNCATDCWTQHPCGAQNPTRVNSSTITTMPATATEGNPTGTGAGGKYSGFGGAVTTAANSKNKNVGSPMMDAAQGYGFAVLLTGLLAGFGLML